MLGKRTAAKKDSILGTGVPEILAAQSNGIYLIATHLMP
jgi:hypothetical protein